MQLRERLRTNCNTNGHQHISLSIFVKSEVVWATSPLLPLRRAWLPAPGPLWGLHGQNSTPFLAVPVSYM